jgi:hypothetical protein
MIQINLLPDVKLKYIKTKRTERIVVFVCGIISTVSIVSIIVLYLTVDVFQKNHLNTVANQITSESATIKNDADVNKIITIQQQLKSLPSLYSNRNNPYEIFNILQQSTSKGITISTFNINYQTGALTFGGTADSLLDGNVFYNQLLYATYSLDKGAQQPLFGGVSISGLSGTTTSSATSSASISYTVKATVPVTLFKTGANVVVSVPNKDVTQSTLNQPSASTFTK